jgi:hypothetical protein
MEQKLQCCSDFVSIKQKILEKRDPADGIDESFQLLG